MDKRTELAAKDRYDINDLLDIMAILRAPDGCPWDKVQTHKSIRSDFIEETYEAVEAIDAESPEMMREELGDVLLQIVFHARLAQEDGQFDFADVVNDICAKLVLRHPHIFGDVKVRGTDDVLKNWDSIKQRTHGRTTVKEALEGVSKALPSLMRASKLAKRAVKNGETLENRFSGETDKAALEQKVGDELFSVAASAALSGVDAEEALYRACERFIASYDENKAL